MLFTSLFPATRWSLIGRLGDDSGATTWIVERYLGGIARYLGSRLPQARRLGLLDDVIQEVGMALLQRPQLLAAARPGPQSRFRHLLMAIALNLGRNALRRLQRGAAVTINLGEVDAVIAAVAQTDPEPEMIREMDRAWALDVLAQAWEDLRGQVETGALESETVVLLERHLLAGVSLRGLVAETGLPLTTCQRRLAAGRQRLQRLLHDRLGDEAGSEDAFAVLYRALGEPGPETSR